MKILQQYHEELIRVHNQFEAKQKQDLNDMKILQQHHEELVRVHNEFEAKQKQDLNDMNVLLKLLDNYF